jgi:hypothetical protein
MNKKNKLRTYKKNIGYGPRYPKRKEKTACKLKKEIRKNCETLIP